MKNQMPLFLESNRQWECFIAKVTREIKWHLIITQQPIVKRYCWPRAHFPPIIVDSKTSGNFKRLMIRALSDSRNVSVGPFTISARPAKPASLKHSSIRVWRQQQGDWLILVAGCTHTDSARRLGGPLLFFVFFKTFLCHGLKVGRTGCL